MTVIILSNKHISYREEFKNVSHCYTENQGKNGKYLFIEFGQFDNSIAIEIEEDDEINIWNN